MRAVSNSHRISRKMWIRSAGSAAGFCWRCFSIVLGLVWILAVGVLDVSQLFAFALGGAVCLELAILARRGRYIALFCAFRAGGLTGRVEYARWLTLRVSAAEHFTFAGLFFVLFLAVGSYLLLGGAVFVLSSGLRHWSSSRRLEQSTRSTHP